MSASQDYIGSKELSNLVEYLEGAKDDPLLLDKVSSDPISVLQSLGIYVEDDFKDSVISQFEALSETISQDAHKAQVKTMSAESKSFAKAVAVEKIVGAPSAPTGLTVQSGKERSATPPEVLNALEFMVKPWGFVLVVREPAIKYLQGGGTIAAGGTGGIAAIAGLGGLAAAGSVLGPLGIGVAVIAGIIAAALGIFSGLITMIDEGKGVYLTWTWVQILPFFNVTQFPIITPIK